MRPWSFYEMLCPVVKAHVLSKKSATRYSGVPPKTRNSNYLNRFACMYFESLSLLSTTKSNTSTEMSLSKRPEGRIRQGL